MSRDHSPRPGAGVEKPVGTIVVRRGHGSRGNRSTRAIKVSMRPPRWKPYARYLWEKHRGPIPRGMNVLHLDLDPLNDDLANLALGKVGDNVFLWHEKNPRASAAQYRRARAGTIEHNRLRGKITRLRRWLPGRWYPVDHTARVVYNRPMRHRYKVWRAMGLEVPACANGDVSDVHAMGWGGVVRVGGVEVGITEACILTALLRGSLAGFELRARVGAMRLERGYPELAERSWAQYPSNLRVAGLIRSNRRGRGRVYALCAGVAERRGVFTPIVPVLGRDLAAGACEGYARDDGELGSRGRLSPRESLELLAAAVAAQTEEAA